MKGTIKRLCAVAAALCMAMSLMAVPAFAADGDEDKNNYIVVFYPGEHGTFAESYTTRLTETLGAENVKTTEAGGVAVMVESGKELGTVVPQMSDIQLSDDRYYVNNVASGLEGVTSITADGSAVAQYSLLQQGQEGSYVVRYLDQETGEEVAPALRGVANLNSQLTLYPVAVTEYNAVGGAQTVTITAGENEIIFYYTPVVHTNNVTEYLPGGTVIEYDDVAVPGGGAVVVGPDEGGEEIDEGETPLTPGTDEGEDIDEGETPLAPGTDEGDEGEDIDENETPQSAGEGMNVGAVVGGVAGVAVIAGLIAWLVTRKKKSGGTQE